MEYKLLLPNKILHLKCAYSTRKVGLVDKMLWKHCEQLDWQLLCCVLAPMKIMYMSFVWLLWHAILKRHFKC